MSKIRYKRAAQGDAVAIWRYIARDSPDFADATLARFTEKLERLADNPMLGTPRPELREELRSFAVGNYVLFYSLLGDVPLAMAASSASKRVLGSLLVMGSDTP
ncbi:type II toxin-antitoxin system RelE/ParE family toxin [Sphingomonas sp. AR_OL41]|uniref:type II toxin-antitoxin system RelE/ParE family toxin n=1 Tax=Sphingomonas sp. AR_OL41 TaxID=3042729 RepID=UPI0024800071|nr:type II toxin-antitoxin system RelE/ParE family toxin [Sphingomonas sp. AR_OL41]MDH7976042.1 type II toxin-antitoxin system RelE/ParE family toxin [Sphingomonas sp. AR_OL41]